MKSFYILLTVLLSLCTNAQTFIPMPNGYGPGMPIFEYNGFLYCKAQSLTDPTYGEIFKVNETTDAVTEITGEQLSWDYDLANLRNIQFSQGEIYLNCWQSSIYKINPIANVISHIVNIADDFIIWGDKIYGAGQVATVYDISSQGTNLILDGIQNIISAGSYFFYNNSIYALGGLYSENNTKKLFRITNQSFTAQTLYTSTENGSFSGIEGNKPILMNDHLLYNYTSEDGLTISVKSLNLNDNSLSTIYTYEDFNISNRNFILNNQIYFYRNNNDVYVSDGNSIAILTDIPNIHKDGGGFAFNPQSPTYGSGGNSTILYNNVVYGEKRINNIDLGTVTYEIWKTDGTLGGTSMISNMFSGPSGAITLNNKMYFQNYPSQYVCEIYRFDDINQSFTNVFSFTGSFGSYLFGAGNSIYLTVYNSNLPEQGLYKLDSTILSTITPSKELKTLIYPNPTSSILNIQTNETIQSIKITDISGRTTSITDFSKNSIDVSSLSNGIYFIELKTNDGVYKEKFIKN